MLNLASTTNLHPPRPPSKRHPTDKTPPKPTQDYVLSSLVFPVYSSSCEFLVVTTTNTSSLATTGSTRLYQKPFSSGALTEIPITVATPSLSPSISPPISTSICLHSLALPSPSPPSLARSYPATNNVCALPPESTIVATFITTDDRSSVTVYTLTVNKVLNGNKFKVTSAPLITPTTHPALSPNFPAPSKEPQSLKNKHNEPCTSTYGGCSAISYQGALLATSLQTNDSPLIAFFSLTTHVAAATHVAATLVGSYPTHHSDIISNLLFHPTLPSLLLSSSEDGTVAIYDTRHPTPQAALLTIIRGAAGGVMTNGLTVFGPAVDKAAQLWNTNPPFPGLEGPTGVSCLCGQNGNSLSVYNGGNGGKMVQVNETRRNDFIRLVERIKTEGEVEENVEDAVGGETDVDYYVKTVWCEGSEGGQAPAGEYYGESRDGSPGVDGGYLVAIGGSFDGIVTPRIVVRDGTDAVYGGDGKEVRLRGGHVETVRTVAAIQGGVITGGEDGRLCVWLRP